MLDKNKYKIRSSKVQPVLFLTDTSKSMNGIKLESLQFALEETVQEFAKHEFNIHVSVVTFGRELDQPVPFTPASQVVLPKLKADGGTPLGPVMEAAYDIVTTPGEMPSPCMNPVVVLVSDGEPDRGWETALEKFVTDERTRKCTRMAVAIGADANMAVLQKFIQGSTPKVYEASEALRIADTFKSLTTYVLGNSAQSMSI